ncbi:MAG: hypothetical protein KME30_24310 [Iphinoe sp. HA4291-MV1]|nr:hypothetical protein [Iphinoe sp. HA4291-MV1]
MPSDADRCDYSREAGESDELTEKEKTPLLMSVKKKGRSTLSRFVAARQRTEGKKYKKIRIFLPSALSIAALPVRAASRREGQVKASRKHFL